MLPPEPRHKALPPERRSHLRRGQSWRVEPPRRLTTSLFNPFPGLRKRSLLTLRAAAGLLAGLLAISTMSWAIPTTRAQDAASDSRIESDSPSEFESEFTTDIPSGFAPKAGSEAGSESESETALESQDPFYSIQRPPGWTYRLRLWNTLGRLYALRGLPPPLPADLRSASGGSIGVEPPALDRSDTLDVLLLGSDRREGNGIWRTDTILLASLDRQTGRVGLVSIPRDLWVSIPGYGSGRINTADWLGSSRGLPDGQLIRETIALNLGLEVDHFVRIDLRGFVAVVDALGGLDVVADCPMEDFFYDPESLGGEQAIELPTGRHHMDGETALRFARSRWQTSDFDRSRRQQRVLRAALGKAREAGFVRRAPALWTTLAPWLSTDIAATDVPGLALLGLRFADRMQLRSAVLGHPATIDWTTPDGSQVLLLNPGAAGDILNNVLAAPDLEDPAMAASRSITVFDASGEAAWEPVMATRLEETGFTAQLESRPAGPQSMLFYAPSAEAAAHEAIRALGLPESVLRPDSAWPGERPASTPLWAHLGGDWEPCGRH